MTFSAYASPPRQTHPSGDLTIAWPKQGDASARFYERHESFLRRGRERPVGLLFLGDSITEQWETVPGLWQHYFGAAEPANFGIGGDGVQHVLWRIEHGELDDLRPRTVVVLVGTNNTRDSTGARIAAGISRILQLIREILPASHVLLLAIFPRGPGVNADGTKDDGVARMQVIRAANARLAKFADGQRIHYLDIGARFLAPAGGILTELMPDQLHLNSAGYRVWAEAISPALRAMH
ncbi:MAG TPA: GDSL-type esterase/lipase family protein [Opitutaceae bacterium]|nr:GDSL-type esterase/lipase family protein [Opitutaceae bacterium]